MPISQTLRGISPSPASSPVEDASRGGRVITVASSLSSIVPAGRMRTPGKHGGIGRGHRPGEHYQFRDARVGYLAVREPAPRT
jgi:hypothetical protein